MMPLSNDAAFNVIVLATAFCFGALSALHLYWAVRGIRAGSAALPERDGKSRFVPERSSALVVALLLALAAEVVLQRAAFIPAVLPARVVPIACWTLAAVMLVRAIGDFRYVGLFKRVRGTRFASLDTKYFSPVAFALALGAGWVALS